MVETRMDVRVSQAVSPAAADRVNRPAVKQAFQLDPTKEPKGVEADVARVFAKRAFQPESGSSDAFRQGEHLLRGRRTIRMHAERNAELGRRGHFLFSV